MNRDLRNALLCALLTAFCILATIPVLEMGVNDDWSYTRTARDLANTGRLVYDGWTVTMMGVQAYWAALFIKLFGFSFTLVRLTTLPLAAGCALLLYALGRRADLSPSLSALGTLFIVLSPVFVPLAASFMTDVPGFFFLLLCIYSLVRALDEEETRVRSGALWLVLAAVAGVLGGTARQAVWLAPLVLLPYGAWMKRRNGHIMAIAAALWGMSALAIAGCMFWFRAQPYAVYDKPLDSLGALLHGFPLSLLVLQPLVFTTTLFLLPVLVGTLTVWRSVLKANRVMLALLFLIWIMKPFPSFDHALAPWTINIVTPWGIMVPGTDAIGSKPEILPYAVRALLSLAVYAMLTLVSLAAAQALVQRLAAGQGANETQKAPPMPTVVCLLTVFTVFYILLLALIADQRTIYDRYVIPILPAATIPLLLYYQRRVGERPHAAAWALTVLFALYGIATTHDYLAIARARLAAASALVATGVPRTHITAGFEYDGWTQVDAAGYINDPRIEVPKGAYRAPNWHNLPVLFWYWSRTPAITPRYLVVLSSQPGLKDSAFPPVSYTTWLPPFHRKVLIQEDAMHVARP
jgi:hypothetical protein